MGVFDLFMNRYDTPRGTHLKKHPTIESLPIGPPFEDPAVVRDLLVIRERHINALLPGIESSDHFIVGICARSGSTSAQLLLKEKLENDGFYVVRTASNPSAITQAAKEVSSLKPSKAVLLIDEAKELEYMQRSGEYKKSPLWDKDMHKALAFFSRAQSKRIKLVFFAHDNYGKKGEGGIFATKRWLETLPTFDRLNIGIDQLECATKEDIGELYDVILKKYQLSSELGQFRARVMETFVSPLQVSSFLSGYREWIGSFPVEHPESVWRFLYSPMINGYDWLTSVEGPLLTTGGKALLDLMYFLLYCNGAIPISELTTEERMLVERYEKFHFFDREGDLIDIRGTYVKDALRRIEELNERERILKK